MTNSARHNPPYVLALDAGTEAIKVGIFDLSGRLISSGVHCYPTIFPKPGWAEQDPQEWWNHLVGAVKDALNKAAIDPKEIIGISADATTCTLIPMKKDGTELRSSLLWMDVRAVDQARRIFETGDEALRYCLAGVNAEWMPAKALWLKENEPEIYQSADYLIEFTDWIIYRLTKRFVLNINTIAQRWFYHTPSGGWPHSLFEKIGLGGVEAKFPEDIMQIGDCAGGLAADVAAELGLPAGIPVATGGGDAFIGLLGLGVVRPGDLGIVLGTSNVVSGLSKEEFHVPGIFGSFPDALIPGLNLVEGGQVSTGAILSWFKRNFAGDLASEAQEKGVSIYKLLDKEAAEIPIGSEGLIVLDYFQGNRTPHTDSLARGMIWGLSLRATRAHIFRALMEGIAYGLNDIIESFNQNDFEARRIIACGGATNSPLFMHIYADVIGKTIYTTKESEASLLGSAIVAATGANAYPSLAEASGKMVEIAGDYAPDMKRHEEYHFFFKKYQQTYPQMKELMHQMSQKVA
jgi:ribulokinase